MLSKLGVFTALVSSASAVEVERGYNPYSGMHKYAGQPQMAVPVMMNYRTQYASCSLADPSGQSEVRGAINIVQTEGERAFVSGSIEGLEEGTASITVHRLGNIQGSCASAGPAVGALTDISVPTYGITSYENMTPNVTLFGHYSIIGRTLAVSDVDGTPVACCVVGYDEPSLENDYVKKAEAVEEHKWGEANSLSIQLKATCKHLKS